MKVLFFFLLFLFSFSFSAFTQPFNAGLLAGGIVSQVDGDTYDGYHKFGFLAGGFVSLKISPHSAFQMELEYIQKGSRQNRDSTNTGNTYLLRLNYIEIPVVYQYTFLKRLSAEIGPAFDILMGSKEEVNGFPLSNSPKPPPPLKSVTLNGIIGVSCNITGHLKANFRFNYSLLSIRKITNANEMPNGYRYILFERGQFNNVMSLCLIYLFRENQN